MDSRIPTMGFQFVVGYDGRDATHIFNSLKPWPYANHQTMLAGALWGEGVEAAATHCSTHTNARMHVQDELFMYEEAVV